jgi:hypothetical protein
MIITGSEKKQRKVILTQSQILWGGDFYTNFEDLSLLGCDAMSLGEKSVGNHVSTYNSGTLL